MDTDKDCLLSVTVFADGTMDVQQPRLFQELQMAAPNKLAVAVVGIQGKQSESYDGTWSFTTTVSVHCQRAHDMANRYTLTFQGHRAPVRRC